MNRPKDRLPSKTVQERQIKKLSARHHEIIERLLLGHRPKDIAKEMRLGRQWLSVIMNSPTFVQALEDRLRGRSKEIDSLIVGIATDQAEREMAIRAKLRALVPEALAVLRSDAHLKSKDLQGSQRLMARKNANDNDGIR